MGETHTFAITYQTADGLESGPHFLEVPEGGYPPTRIDRAVSPSLRVHADPDDALTAIRHRRYEILDLNNLHRTATYREVAL